MWRCPAARDALRGGTWEAAHALLTRGAKWSWLKAWGVRVAQRRGMRRAIVAVAGRLAVVLHRAYLEEKREPRVTGESKRKTAGDMS